MVKYGHICWVKLVEEGLEQLVYSLGFTCIIAELPGLLP